MTARQLETIAALRQCNYPYSFIGRELGLSINTVKSICRRKGISAVGARKNKCEKQKAPLCPNCHTVIEGRKSQRFCSDACRIEWWKNQRRVIEKQP